MAVHGGTVGYADAFTGFGTLVIVDHGGETYSLYGYLASASVERGQAVEAGRSSAASARRLPGRRPCTSRSASTAVRSIPYNG